MEELQKAKHERLEQMRKMGIGKFQKEDEEANRTPITTPQANTSSAGPTHRDPWAPPHGWIGAPAVGGLIADTFVPSKAPLDGRWSGRIPTERRYTPADALRLASKAANGRPVELVIDLTNSNRYYDPHEFEKNKTCRYVKVACVGKDSPPDCVAVTRFVYEVGKFLSERSQRNSKGVILVHCTHGFNRTGAMIVHHLQRTRPWPKLNENIAEFAKARWSEDSSAVDGSNDINGSNATEGNEPSANQNIPPPCGIYKPEYLKSLFDSYLERRFRTTVDPELPAWKRKEYTSDAPPVEDSKVPEDDLFGVSNPEYMYTKATSSAPRPGGGIPIGAIASDDSPSTSERITTTVGGNVDGSKMHHDDVLGQPVYEGQSREIKNVVLWLCGQEGSRFPGSQPVSLARDNMNELSKQSYHVTWKADGSRYMLLLMRDGVYLIDRKFTIRRVTLRCPAPLKTHGVTTHNATLLDGEMVVDDLPDGTQRRRFLAYDCVSVFGEKLIDKPFIERFDRIARQVIEPRNVFLADAGKSGAYDFSKEPFSVRRKDFAPLPGTAKFINEFIPKLTHECDGLIFQPSKARYENGTMSSLLKWKFTHLNSVDFLLKMVWVDGVQTPVPKLYVGGDRDSLLEVFEPSGGFMLVGSEELNEGFDPNIAADGSTVQDLNGKIVECAWDKNADSSDGSNAASSHFQGAWRYMRVRSDKDTPNYVTVYKHTLQSILDNITSEEIALFVNDVLETQKRASADAGMGYA